MSYESFGKYILLEKLATGGMAEVFLARGTGTAGIGKFFAIKRILPQYADSPEFIDMFKDEAKIAINLSHSNIVSIHEFGVEKGQFFLVMDYVEGRNLRQVLNKMKKSALQFSMDQIVFCIKEVAAGLDHAHRCIDGSTGKPLNITHRDMSPQNVMLSFEGEVKIVDFGIAKAESQIETTRAGTLKGKFGYMSPEQAEGQPVDLRTDIFSLGIVAWELLANDRLFVANNEINTLRKIRDCQIPSLRKINPNIHTELERIVQKALARDRNLRYQIGAALHRDLNRFLNRQYPDFSPQDFSVFIKSVFADEILSLRKRLVEYAKVNLTVNLNISTEDFNQRSNLISGQTNSLVISSSSSGAKLNEMVSGKDSLSGKSIAPDTNSGVVVKPDTASISANPTDSKISTQTKEHTVPPEPKSGTATGSILDEGALLAEAQREVSIRPKVPVKLETEEVTSPSIPSQTRSMNRHVPRPPPKQKKPARMFTFMVFIVLCISLYSYLAKYMTAMMMPVIAVTDSYIHPLHVWIGVDPHTTESSSSEPKQNVTAQPLPPDPPVAANPPAQPPQVAQPSVETAPTPAPPPPSRNDPQLSGTTGVVVTSNPSGAEILINDKSTGMVTPSRVQVPRGKFDITIRKPGYQDQSWKEVTRDELGHKLLANLVKVNLAYVDIDVFPPQEAIITVNGKRLPPQNGPIRQMAVPANQPVKIRAETRTAFDEITVNLPVDKRQQIQLNPHKPSRLPAEE